MLEVFIIEEQKRAGRRSRPSAEAPRINLPTAHPPTDAGSEPPQSAPRGVTTIDILGGDRDHQR